MENTILCPKCGSSEVEKRNHEQQLTKIGGVLLSSAGATAGTVGGAASGASIGAAIGAAAGRPRLVTAAQDRFSSMTEVAGVGQDRGWKGAVACCISSALLIRDRSESSALRPIGPRPQLCLNILQ